MPSTTSRLLRGLVVALPLAAIAATLGVGWVSADRLMHPARLAIHDEPARYGLAPEHLAIKSLDAWLFKHPGDQGLAVLFLHGWGSHNQHMLMPYLGWLARGHTVLAFDMENHGESPAGATTMGPRELLDAHTAADFLKGRGYKRLVLMGTSMGGAVAIDLAAEEPAVAGVITDGAFSRPEVVVASHLGRHGYPFPGLLADVTLAELGWRTGTSEARAIDHVARLRGRPLLMIHGEKDHVVPVEDAKRLFAAAREPKQLWLVPGADHMSEAATGPHAVDPGHYEARVQAFLGSLAL